MNLNSFFRILFGTLRAVVIILIVMFGFVPVLFRYTYPLQRTVIFLNFGKYNIWYSLECMGELFSSIEQSRFRESDSSLAVQYCDF